MKLISTATFKMCAEKVDDICYSVKHSLVGYYGRKLGKGCMSTQTNRLASRSDDFLPGTADVGRSLSFPLNKTLFSGLSNITLIIWFHVTLFYHGKAGPIVEQIILKSIDMKIFQFDTDTESGALHIDILRPALSVSTNLRLDTKDGKREFLDTLKKTIDLTLQSRKL